jgi:hypothetical protein
MREIYYNSDITPKSERELKLLTLYYDKIHIVNDAVYSPKFENLNGKFEYVGVEDHQFIPKSFGSDYKILLDEKIVTITKREENQEDEYEKLFSERISKLLNSNESQIFPNHPTETDSRIITEEVYDVMKHMFNFEWGKPIEKELVWWYYAFKLKWFLKLLMEGKNCISSSNNLNYLFSSFIRESSNPNLLVQGYRKSLALDALKISLPNPDVLSFEDILELRLKLKDELGMFRQVINEIEFRNKNLFSSIVDQSEYQVLFFNEIQKPLRDLEIKMQNLKSRSFRSFIEKMKTTDSYVPLITTVVASVPLKYAVLASLGLISVQSYLEYKEEQRELTNNGLYFLIKLQ